MPSQVAGEEREAGKRKNDCDSLVDTERSSISTTSSATSSSNGRHWTSSSANKLSKFGRRIRDSCRNLKGRQSQSSKGSSSIHNPEEFSSFQIPNESTRSKVYVAMDFSGRQEGRILENPKDVRACDKASTATKDGYVPFRRRVAAPVADRLTETQATVHRCQAWYHAAMTRDKANKILAAHCNSDGVFLVRESSVAGGFVISLTAANKNIHSQVLPLATPDGVVYSLDDGKNKFYDLLQLVEFYQLNAGSLPTRLKHFIVNMESGERPDTKQTNGAAASKEEDRVDSPDCGAGAEGGEETEEVDSAMSQDGASSDEEGTNREQPQQG